MKTPNRSSSSTLTSALLLMILTGSAPVSGQTLQQADPRSSLSTARSPLEVGTAAPSIDAPPAAGAPLDTVSRRPTRGRAVRNGARGATKPVAIEPRTDLVSSVPNPAPIVGDGAAAQSAAADSAGAPVPNENYPPDPTPAPVASSATEDIGPAKTAPPPQVEHPDPALVSPDYSMVKAAGGFGLVLCLIALAYLGGRRMFPKYFARKGTVKNLRLIETLAIGEKRSIAVIEFDDQRLIIGNTPTQITLLAALPLKLSLVEDSQAAPASPFDLSKAKITSDTFKGLYEIEKTNGRGNRKAIPPDIQAKMRQLRESLEH